MCIIPIDYRKVDFKNGWYFTIKNGYYILPSKERMKTFLSRNNITQRSLMDMMHLEDITYGLQRKEV